MKEIDLGECRRTIELLPWYANASLPDEERKFVAAHLKDCAACRREAEFLGAIIEAMPEPRAAHAGSAPFSALLQKINQAEQRRRRWKMAAALLLVAGLALALPFHLLQPRFQTVTNPAATGDTRLQLVMRFADEDVGAMADVLERHGGELVAGPQPDHSFVIEFPVGDNGDALLQQLQDDPRVLEVHPVKAR